MYARVWKKCWSEFCGLCTFFTCHIVFKLSAIFYFFVIAVINSIMALVCMCIWNEEERKEYENVLRWIDWCLHVYPSDSERVIKLYYVSTLGSTLTVCGDTHIPTTACSYFLCIIERLQMKVKILFLCWKLGSWFKNWEGLGKHWIRR